MEIWRYNVECIDQDFKEKLKAQHEELVGLVEIRFSDGVLRVSKRQAFMNLIYWRIPNAFNIPLRKDHFIRYCHPSRGNLSGSWNRYYHEISEKYPTEGDKLKVAIWETWQELYSFCCSELMEYVSSIDICDMADVMHDPPMKEILDRRKQICPEIGSDAVEKLIEISGDEIVKLISKKGALQCDALTPFQNVGMLNRHQIPQVMFAYGPRTDINNVLIRYPVAGNSTEGLNDALEVAVETLSAKKPLCNNKQSVPTSQYANRKYQLVCSTLPKIYQGDCGSKLLVKFFVTEKNCWTIVGKTIFHNGMFMVVSSSATARNFVNTEIMMRSPMTCRYLDGVCTACGGRVVQNMCPSYNPGIVSSALLIAQVTQKILSAKHLVKTDSQIYSIPGPTDDILYRDGTNTLAWKPNIAKNIHKYQMGVSLDDTIAVHDVVLLKSDKQIKEERFSSIRSFRLKNMETGDELIYPLDNGDDEQIPYFSADMLLHIKENHNKLKIDESNMWIPLKGTENISIFGFAISSDDVAKFVKKVHKYLSDTILTETTCEGALKHFSELVYSNASVNIALIEILLRAYMIRSKADYRVPHVTDPDNVKFGSTMNILSKRHIGTELAFQGLYSFITNPTTYLIPKQSSEALDALTIGV